MMTLRLLLITARYRLCLLRNHNKLMIKLIIKGLSADLPKFTIDNSYSAE
jgi:hypothetical protein